MGFIVFEYFPDASPPWSRDKKNASSAAANDFLFFKNILWNRFKRPKPARYPMKVVAKPNLEKQKKNMIFRENLDFSPISARLGANPGQIRAGQKNPRSES